MAVPLRFRGTTRQFRSALKSGLAVVDVPKPVAAELGGLKQMRVSGKLNDREFRANTPPPAGELRQVDAPR